MIGIDLLQMSLLGAVMILVICVLRALLKKRVSARTIMLLWYGSVLRLLLPFSVRLPAAMCGWLTDLADAQKAGGVTGHAPEPVRLWTEGLVFSENRRIILDMTAHSMWQMRAGFGVWLAGMAVVSVYFAVNYIRCRSIFKQSLPVRGLPAPRQYIRRKVEIRSLDRITSPLTYGVLRPVILLPKELLASGGAGEKEALLQCILLHESVHIKRFDALMKLILAAALAVHWFNPAVWLLYRLANRDMEICCDEAVIRQLGEEKRSFYALSLLWAEEKRCKNTALYTCFSGNVLEERVRMIMMKKKITGPGALLSGAAAVVICAAFVMSMDPSKASEDISAENTQSILTEASAAETTAIMEETETAEPAKQSGQPEQEAEQVFIWPSKECSRVTAVYGERIHPITGETAAMNHITISGEYGGEWEGTAICAVADGVVAETGFDAEKGNYIVLEHADGLSTEYTHCKTVETEKGARVLQGDTIGTMGKTGQATGPCLGFYVYQEGENQNPMNYYPDIVILMNFE